MHSIHQLLVRPLCQKFAHPCCRIILFKFFIIIIIKNHSWAPDFHTTELRVDQVKHRICHVTCREVVAVHRSNKCRNSEAERKKLQIGLTACSPTQVAGSVSLMRHVRRVDCPQRFMSDPPKIPVCAALVCGGNGQIRSQPGLSGPPPFTQSCW